MFTQTILCIEENSAKKAQWQQELSALEQKFTLLFTDSDISDPVQKQNIALIICGKPKDRQKTLNLLSRLKLAGNNCTVVLVEAKRNQDFLLELVDLAVPTFCLGDFKQQGILLSTLEQLMRPSLKKDAQLRLFGSTEHDPIMPHVLDSLGDLYKEGDLSYSDQKLAKQLVVELLEYFDKQSDKKACLRYSPNHLLTREGTPNAFLWFVIEGEIDLFKEDNLGNTYQLASLGKGSLIGSMSFISGDLSFSTTKTRTNAQVIKVDRSTFNELMLSKHSLIPLFTRYLLKHFNHRLRSSIRTEVTLQQTLQSLDVAHHALINKEKMAMLGQLVAGVAHELNNPISAILSNTENLKDIIPALINMSLNEVAQYKAKQIMANALIATPISTMEARAKSQAISDKFNNRNLPRKVVNMGISEELDNLLAVFGDELELKLTQFEKFYQAGSLIRSNLVCAKRIAEMVKSLKGYAREDSNNVQLVDLHEGIEDTIKIFENRIKLVDFIRDYSDLPSIYCKPNALQQVWTNLLSNALDSIENQGEIQISTKQCMHLLKPAVEVTVKDNGVGIPTAHQEKIFELNFTTKKEGHFGLGIGLSICKQIVQDHQGLIEVESELNKYTAIRVILPILSSIDNK